jgi:hypothetical protein
MSDATTEERLDRLEQLLDRAIALARKYPLGRVILARLGVDDA